MCKSQNVSVMEESGINYIQITLTVKQEATLFVIKFLWETVGYVATYTSKTMQPIEAVVMPTETVAMHAQCILHVCNVCVSLAEH